MIRARKKAKHPEEFERELKGSQSPSSTNIMMVAKYRLPAGQRWVLPVRRVLMVSVRITDPLKGIGP